MVMQTAFFKLANVVPFQDAVKYLKDSIAKTYGNKGQSIVEMNQSAVDKSIEALQKVTVPASWSEAADEYPGQSKDEPDFVKKIQRPMARQEGDDLPVSTFVGMEDGTHPLGTTAYEKRGIAVMLPEWQIDTCIQCNQCSYICPHATVRPFLLTKEEKDKAPDTFKTKDAVGKEIKDLQFRIQIAPLDCTGCGNCADICPAPGKALIMKPADHEIEMEAENWEFARTVTPKDELINPNTLKGSQFVQPVLEFSGACPGCGETPYIKLLTQLFGDRMMIANATGCSSIYGASSPSIAYTVNAEGKGPAWANSLFEDSAEFGYGMHLGVRQIRGKLAALMKEALAFPLKEELKNAFQNGWTG